ncbi:hypothetical protein BGW38_008403, partial [Lunasporangiospora selenospora]
MTAEPRLLDSSSSASRGRGRGRGRGPALKELAIFRDRFRDPSSRESSQCNQQAR